MVQKSIARRKPGTVGTMRMLGRFSKEGLKTVGRAAYSHLVAKAGKYVVNRAVGKNKTKRRRPTPTLMHADMALQKFVMPGRKRGKVKISREGRISYTDTYQGIFSGPSGLQNFIDLRNVHNRNQIMNEAESSVENSVNHWNTSVFRLLPSRANTGGGVIPVGTNSVTFTSEVIFCSKQYSQLSVTNLQNTAVHCEIYWCLAKNDTNNGPATTWAADTENYGLGQPTWIQPTKELDVPVGGKPNPYMHGDDPTSNGHFKRMWKVVSKKEFVLQSGNTLRFEYSRPVNKMIRRADINNTPSFFLKGLTLVPMIIAKGAPVDMYVNADWPAPLIPISQINHSTTKIGIIQRDTMIYHPQPEKTMPYNRTFSSNINAPAGLITQRFINDDDQLDTVEQA